MKYRGSSIPSLKKLGNSTAFLVVLFSFWKKESLYVKEKEFSKGEPVSRGRLFR